MHRKPSLFIPSRSIALVLLFFLEKSTPTQKQKVKPKAHQCRASERGGRSGRDVSLLWFCLRMWEFYHETTFIAALNKNHAPTHRHQKQKEEKIDGKQRVVQKSSTGSPSFLFLSFLFFVFFLLLPHFLLLHFCFSHFSLFFFPFIPIYPHLSRLALSFSRLFLLLSLFDPPSNHGIYKDF